MACKKRMKNFTDEECAALAEAVHQVKDILFGKLTNVITSQKKQKSWAVVTEKVNAVSAEGVIRTIEQVKKKWYDMARVAKQKEVHRRKEQRRTGGGAAPPTLNTVDGQIINIIGDEVIEGIEGGIDTEENSETISTCSTNKEENLLDTDDTGTQEDEIVIEPSGSDTSCSTQSFLPCRPRKDNKQRSITPSYKRKEVVPAEDNLNETTQLIEIEKQRLAIEKRRLMIEEKRLAIEQERLAMEKGRNNLDNYEKNDDEIDYASNITSNDQFEMTPSGFTYQVL